jgi:hypothetical protein
LAEAERLHGFTARRSLAGKMKADDSGSAPIEQSPVKIVEISLGAAA